MMHMAKYLATTVLLAFLCVDLACGLVLSGPSLVSSPPPQSATTCSADSRLYLSYSPPSSLAEGVATWVAAREPNQSIRPFIPTSVPTAQTDTSQDAVPDWKEQLGSFAGVATVVSAAATSVATVGGIAMALRMDGREKGRDEREERWRVEDRIERREDNLRSSKQEIRRCKSTKLFHFLLAPYIALADSYVGLSCVSLFQINDSLEGIT